MTFTPPDGGAIRRGPGSSAQRSATALRRVRADWTRLGAADPLWAVLVRPDARHDRWDTGQFLATGRAEVAAALDRAAEFGARPGRDRAVDFGCGAGRLAQALAEHVSEVVAVDISEPMLAAARRLDPPDTVHFVLNDAPDLGFLRSRSVDVSYSSLALQHLAPGLARSYLAELVRVLRPGGLLVVQTATVPDASLRGRLARALPRRAMRLAQRTVLRYPAPMEMHAMPTAVVAEVVTAAGGSMLASEPAQMYGGHWHYTRHYAVRA